MSTGNKPIVEISYKDQFWGAKPVGGDILIGDNVLGELLVALREKLQQANRELFKVVEPLKIPNLTYTTVR